MGNSTRCALVACSPPSAFLRAYSPYAPFLFRAPTAARFFCHFESEQVQPSSSDYYRDEPNPEYEPTGKEKTY